MTETAHKPGRRSLAAVTATSLSAARGAVPGDPPGGTAASASLLVIDEIQHVEFPHPPADSDSVSGENSYGHPAEQHKVTRQRRPSELQSQAPARKR